MQFDETELELVKFESDDVGIMLLESITQGLYHNPLNSIREYVQNEYDAHAREIRIIAAPDKITITGDGVGMSKEELLDARKIGFSMKTPGKDVGFRGIGIWSGVAICDEIFISTKKQDEQIGDVLQIDARGLRMDIEEGRLSLIEALSNRVAYGRSEKVKMEQKGTSIELRRLLPEHSNVLEAKTLQSYVSQILPVRLDKKYQYSDLIEERLKKNIPDYRTVKIYVNDVPIFRPPSEDIQTTEPVFYDIRGPDDRRIAYYWYTISKKKMIKMEARNPIYKKKGFTVGDSTRSNILILKVRDKGALQWTTGEVHVIDNEILPTAERIEFESGPALRELESQLTSLLAEVVKTVRKHQAGNTSIDRMKRSDELIEQLIPTADFDEREENLTEGRNLLRLMGQDLENPRIISSTVKSGIRKRMKKLKKALQEYSTADPEDVPEETEERKTKRRKRQKNERIESISIEDLLGRLGAVFDFDGESRSLLLAVMRAFGRYVKSDQQKVDKFVELLRKELEGLREQDQSQK